MSAPSAFHHDYLLHGNPGCYRRSDPKCSCPHPMYALSIDLRTGATSKKRFYCGCCLEDMRPSAEMIQTFPSRDGTLP